MDYSPPGSSIHEILQGRILEWVAIPFSKGSSWPRDWTQASHIPGRFSTVWATKEAAPAPSAKIDKAMTQIGMGGDVIENQGQALNWRKDLPKERR